MEARITLQEIKQTWPMYTVEENNFFVCKIMIIFLSIHSNMHFGC